MFQKIIFLSIFVGLVAVIAYNCSHFDQSSFTIATSFQSLLKFVDPYINFKTEKSSPETEQSNSKTGKSSSKIDSSDRKEILLTADELKKFNGENENPVYVAFLGKIYDVEKGRRHYGPGGGYHFFSGKDASRAFVSGDFSDSGLVDNVLDFSHADMLGVKQWMEFYEDDYTFIGKVIGRYYDEKGQNTKELKNVWNAILRAEQWQRKNDDEKKIFPPCNSEWSHEIGGRVWCSTLSGGIERNWVGVPRMYHKPGTTLTRCVCVRNSGPPNGWNAASGSSHQNRGDLDNPNLRIYPDCELSSESCTTKD